MTQTKKEIRKAWEKANMKAYTFILHKERDKNYITVLDNESKKHGMTNALRKAFQKLLD